MKLLFRRHTLRYIALSILGLVILMFSAHAALKDDTRGREQARVERGNVEVMVSVSGTVRTKNTATLGFTGIGMIEEILVKEGDRVEKGQVLASLVRSAEIAEYNNALATLASSEAALDALISGPRGEEREVTASEVAIKTEDLARTIREEAQRVENARRALHSHGLEATPDDQGEDAAAPIISGSYDCEEPKTYRFDTYPSNAESGYSFRITEGDGTQTSSAVTQSAISFGTCGLYIQFIAEANYGYSSWSVTVPNTKGASYTTDRNAYDLALKSETNNVSAARQALEKAQKEEGLANASPRREELVQARADVDQALARVAAAEAKITDNTIRAPFPGIISAVDIAVGEIARGDLGITMTANDTYELKIRVPEIDITKITTGDRAYASFDAKAEERVPLSIAFISPLPTEIDGVSYYEALLAFDTAPAWMRTGLNADVDVVIDEAKDTLKLAKRFLTRTENGSMVKVLEDRVETEVGIRTGLEGNDGSIEVFDLPEGTVVIAP